VQAAEIVTMVLDHGKLRVREILAKMNITKSKGAFAPSMVRV